MNSQISPLHSYTPPSPDKLSEMLAKVRYDAAGLVSAIAQHYETHEVLMLAWMTQEALYETLTTGRLCYYSRSRQKLWRKGETSGQFQYLVEARLDCDGDTLLFFVAPAGVACHTGRRSCFYRAFTPQGLITLTRPEKDPHELYPNLDHSSMSP